VRFQFGAKLGIPVGVADKDPERSCAQWAEAGEVPIIDEKIRPVSSKKVEQLAPSDKDYLP
jgi:hypothetical protein